MTDPEQEQSEQSWMNRRSVLKSAAATGLAATALTGSASAGGDNEKKELRFDSIDHRLFSYHVKVSGSIERAPNRDGGDTRVDHQTAEGKARGGNHDDWYMTGEIEEMKLEGPGKVLIDGEVIEDTTKKDTHEGEKDTDKGGDDTDKGGDDTDQARDVVVLSPGIEEYRDYSFVVDGRAELLEPDEDGRPAVDRVVEMDGQSKVEGTVGYGDDRFRIYGPIVERNFPEGVELRFL